MRRTIAACAALLLLSGCRYVSFARPRSDDELRLEREVRAYYNEVRLAFAAGNSQALSSLFDPNITKPMTKAQVDAWADKFFNEHGRARFRIKHFELEELGFERAVVLLEYAVEPSSGHGGFGGSERDTLVKRGGRWYTASWEKIAK